MAAQIISYPDYTIIVKICCPPTKHEKLATYFGSRKRGGGGEITAITYPWRNEEYALVEFDSGENDQNVVQRVCSHTHTGYKVKPYDQQSPYGELETPLRDQVFDALRKQYAGETNEFTRWLENESVSGVRLCVENSRCTVTGYWHQLQAFQNYISSLLGEPRMSDTLLPVLPAESPVNRQVDLVPPPPDTDSEDWDEETAQNKVESSNETPPLRGVVKENQKVMGPDILKGAVRGSSEVHRANEICTEKGERGGARRSPKKDERRLNSTVRRLKQNERRSSETDSEDGDEETAQNEIERSHERHTRGGSVNENQRVPESGVLEGAVGGSSDEHRVKESHTERGRRRNGETNRRRPSAERRQKSNERREESVGKRQKSNESGSDEQRSKESLRVDDREKVSERHAVKENLAERHTDRRESDDGIFKVRESNVDKDIYEFLVGTAEFSALQVQYAATEITSIDDPQNQVMTELLFACRSLEEAENCKNSFVELLVTKAGSLTHDVIDIQSKDKSLVSKIPKTHDYTFRLIGDTKIKVTAQHSNIEDAVSRIKNHMSSLKRTAEYKPIPEPGAAARTTNEANQFKFDDLTVKLVISDITTMEVDMIVNAANGFLQHDGGLAYAIAKKLSMGSVSEGCDRIRRQGKIPNGEVWTQKTSDQLARTGIKWLTHAVGPIWIKMGMNKTVETELANAVCNSLLAADQRECFSIALPLISSGIYGVPPVVCAQSYLLGIKRYLTRQAKRMSYVRDVYFVDLKSDVLRHVEREFQKGLESVKEKPVQEKPVRENHSNHGGRGRGWQKFPDGRSPGARAEEQKSMEWEDASGNDEEKFGADSGQKPSTTTLGDYVKTALDSLNIGGGATSSSSTASETEKTGSRREKSKPKKGAMKHSPENKKPPAVEKLACPVCFEEDHSTFEVLRPCTHIMCRNCIKDYRDKGFQPTCPRCTQRYANLPGESSRSDKVFDRQEDAQQGSQADADKPSCPICCGDDRSELQTLRCSHFMCHDCMKRYKEGRIMPKCPRCNQFFDKAIGQQPNGGTMRTNNNAVRLAGHGAYGTIEISYNIPSGVQQSYHPNPGQRYTGVSRTAFLPNSPRGQNLATLLRKAFDQKLIFTVGRSVTTGADNQVVWNNIHHKTGYSGTYGYPDHTYLDRLEAELNDVGIN